ncbi:TPA: hypothetical protein EYN65_23895 [Candidatus Poribacteria bacterium]|nr:hypothetical protein [Candidatus Poribacteria bacterium]
MAELIQSAGNFYLNAEQYNAETKPVEAFIQISDRDDILSRQDNWAVHITRFAIDTQTSLFYVPPDSDATVTLTSFNYVYEHRQRLDTTKHFTDRRTVNMANGASTLSDFLEQLNGGVPLLNSHDQADFGELAHVAGSGGRYKAGRWSITASGAFRFEAKATVDGEEWGQHAAFDAGQMEYFVNIQVSESMRTILGFKDSEQNILGNESSLATYKRQIANFQAALPTYRNDIKNWRWDGTTMQHKRCPWYTDMWYIINNVILQGVPFVGQGGGAEIGTLRPDLDFHPADKFVGSYARAPGYMNGIGYWEDSDFLIANYRSAHNHTADSGHEMTMFSFIYDLTADHGEHLPAEIELRTFFKGYNIVNDEVLNVADLTWDETQGYDDSAVDFDYTGLTRGRWAYQMNSKQVWGSWNRAYITGLINPRQMHLNRENLTANTVLASVVDNGGVAHGGAPIVGDTIYIPDARNLDGSGTYAGNAPVGYTRYQRGIITAVTESTFVRAPNCPADNTWLVTFDTTIETHADRLLHLNAYQANGDPQARLAFGTRRIPYTPMVYISPISATSNVLNDGLSFLTDREFPVSVGDIVYVGHNPTDSETQHTVSEVDFATGVVTITAENLTTIAGGTVVIGFGSAWDTVFAADCIAHDITCTSLFIHDTTLAVNHATVRNHIIRLNEALINAPSTSHLDVQPASNFGIHALTEAEMGIPRLSSIDSVSGSVTIPSGVVRGGNDSGQNTVVISDMTAYMGASPQWDGLVALTHVNNIRNLCPSNYFLVDAPETTGIYENAEFVSFMNGHISEDWFLYFNHLRATDGINNDGVFTASNSSAIYGIDGPNNLINHNSGAVVPMTYHRLENVFKLCGRVTMDAVAAWEPLNPVFQNLKYVVFVRDRTLYPGAVQHNANYQFFKVYGAQAAANDFGLITSYDVGSGWKEMDAVQAVYKSNTTLSIVNNPAGLNLSIRSNDSFTSELNGQVDLAFPYKSISLTSPDLLAIPERTGDANSLQPILSSYSIPTVFDASAKMTGEVTGFTSTPYGTVTFSEGGSRRYHSLNAIPGGLRQFSVMCVLDPKDDSRAKTRMMIPAGGRFSCQFLFVRKV